MHRAKTRLAGVTTGRQKQIVTMGVLILHMTQLPSAHYDFMALPKTAINHAKEADISKHFCNVTQYHTSFISKCS